MTAAQIIGVAQDEEADMTAVAIAALEAGADPLAVFRDVVGRMLASGPMDLPGDMVRGEWGDVDSKDDILRVYVETDNTLCVTVPEVAQLIWDVGTPDSLTELGECATAILAHFRESLIETAK